MNNLKEFTHLYPVQKTLRFELKPIGKTREWIETNGLLKSDEHRAESYKIVKKIIDFYHKHFIELSLRNLQYKDTIAIEKDLNEYKSLIGKTDPTLKKKLEKVQDSLRKVIANLFDTKRLFGKELIKEDLMMFLYECEKDGVVLPEDLTIDECKSIIGEFTEFTTYFSGFNENRKNMYSNESKSTAIAYRLIHENLPKFIANMSCWEKIKETLGENLSEVEKSMSRELNGKSLSEYFENISSYLDCLTQSGITKYNTLIGGRSEGNVKIKGVNECINLYNQKVDRKSRLPKMTELYKMILSDRVTLSWLSDKFENDNQLLESVRKVYDEIHSTIFEGSSEAISLKELISNISDYDTNGIYIKNDTTITNVLTQSYGEWSILNRGMMSAYDKANPVTDKKKQKKHEENRAKWIKSFESFSIDDVCHYVGSNEIIAWYKNLWSKEGKTAFEYVEYTYNQVKDLLNTAYKGNLKEDSDSIKLLKVFLDSLKNLQRLAATLKGNGDETGRDNRFYAEWDRLVDTLDQVTPLYNMVRNYVTQKAYSEEKFKLNFENGGNFLNGWVDSKTEKSDNGTQYGGYLFRKKNSIGEYDYFLGISADKKLFREKSVNDNEDCYERLNYYQLKGQTFYGNAYVGDYQQDKDQWKNTIRCFLEKNESNEIMDDSPFKTLKKIKTKPELYEKLLKDYEYIKASDNLKNNIKKTLSLLARVPQAKELSKIVDLDIIELQEEIDNISSKKIFSYFPVPTTDIDSAMNTENKKLYLFKITNKDLSFAENFEKGIRKKDNRGLDNLHTMYFKSLMQEGQTSIDIGTAEIFFRRKSITYDDSHLEHGFHYDTLNKKFNYPIYKDRRYSMDKFLFHLSINLNYSAQKTSSTDLNNKVREFIKNNGVEHIIGIDRGERHLLYLSLIDLKGNIKEQFTLNSIENEKKTTNYHNLLDKKEVNRDEARKNWKTIEGIKDLKEGYLSQVVHIISKMMVEYNAIVVLEDLNSGFMRGRQKVEKQVYQKFEKILIDKLNYLVDKKQPVDKTLGVLNALQLTSNFDSFQNLGKQKQSGFLFYVPAALTSKIDPVTGFANYISTKYINKEKTKELLKNFKDIRYNKTKDYFEFEIEEYSKFNPKATGRQQWTICSYGERIETFRNPEKNNENNKQINPTQELKNLFVSCNIDYNKDLFKQILNVDKASFYEEILHLLKLILQMRNSITKTERDFIISPVADANGRFYNSEDKIENLPIDADANGAYNIARKGLWIVKQIQQAEDVSNVSLAMKNEEWMNFAQQKPYLND